ncbi:MAG TPA: 3-oxoacyl-ACP synthase [Deltaproteobacteria bacterium]|nr:3-oxoacyl-ACP synthase [Deltaproteobacteria bacterium]
MPEKVLDNRHFYEGLGLDTNEEWILSRTGIHQRRIADVANGEGTARMSVHAARQCLDRAGLTPEDVDGILVATITGDLTFPATACVVQAELGAKNAFAWDVSAACSGYVFTLAQATAMIRSGMARRILVIGAETMSSILDYTDRNTCIIFGDGAGATLVEKAEDGRGGEILDFCMCTDGNGVEPLHMPAGGALRPPSHETVDERLHFVKQDGRTVFKHAVTRISEVILQLLDKNGLDANDIDLVVPHQANIRIIEACWKKLKIPKERVVVTVDQWANTTAATIPTSLDYALEEGLIQPGANVVFATFGAGFTWGSTLLKW